MCKKVIWGSYNIFSNVLLRGHTSAINKSKNLNYLVVLDYGVLGENLKVYCPEDGRYSP